MSLQSLLPKPVRESNLRFWELLFLTCRVLTVGVVPPLLVLQWELVYDLLKLSTNRVFSLIFFPWLDGIWCFSKVNDMRYMIGCIHLSPLLNIFSWLHYAGAAFPVREGIGLCDPFPPLASSWQAGNNWKNHPRILPVVFEHVTLRHARKPTFSSAVCFVGMTPYYNILGSLVAGCCVCWRGKSQEADD